MGKESGRVSLDALAGDLEGKSGFVGPILSQYPAAVEKHFGVSREAVAQREITDSGAKRRLDHLPRCPKGDNRLLLARLVVENFTGVQPRQGDSRGAVAPVRGKIQGPLSA